MPEHLIDTSVLIDVLRGRQEAVAVLIAARVEGALHSSVLVRAEVLAGMRPAEEEPTLALLGALRIHDVTSDIADLAGALGRQWLPSHSGIDTADLVIAATAKRIGLRLVTSNVRHFPMFPGLQAPY